MRPKIALFWHRRDLRLADNVGLAAALAGGLPVLPVFVYDKNILDELPRHDRRVVFIHRATQAQRREYEAQGGTLWAHYGRPLDMLESLCERFAVRALYLNRDYEPYARERERAVHEFCQARGIALHHYKDHVVFDRSEIMTIQGAGQGQPYRVFTPYSRQWLARLVAADHLAEAPSAPLARKPGALAAIEAPPLPSLESMGFADEGGPDFPAPELAQETLRRYGQRRDYPAEASTSRLGVHLRFGTVSIRALARQALPESDVFLKELIWRDFYAQVLWHNPHVVGRACKPEFDAVPFRQAPEELERWKEGRTGYPLVDAGMRELAATGFMHNRVRMVAASFLVKHLLLDWRQGEAHFALHLLDFDLASNNGSWQWVAGTGCDAAPYFRVFNPLEQARKFDPEGAYVRKWVPEYGTPAYPAPMVEHRFARERALAAYKAAMQKA